MSAPNVRDNASYTAVGEIKRGSHRQDKENFLNGTQHESSPGIKKSLPVFEKRFSQQSGDCFAANARNPGAFCRSTDIMVIV